MREKYETLQLSFLREIAKSRGMKNISTLRKADLINALVAEDEKDAAQKQGQSDSDAQKNVESIDDRKQQVKTPVTDNAKALEEMTAVVAGASVSDQVVRENRSDYAAGTPVQRQNGIQRRAGAPRREGTSQRSAQPRQDGASRQENVQRTESGAQRSAQPRQDGASRQENVQRTESGAQRSAQPRQDGASRQENAQRTESNAQRSTQPRQDGASRQENVQRTESNAQRSTQPRQENGQDRDRVPMDLASLDSGNEASGILEVMAEGYGFIRSSNYLPGENDIYVAPSQIRRFNLKTGDVIAGNTRVRAQQEKFSALLYLKTINGFTPNEAAKRCTFEDMTPIFPNERLRMERGSKETAMRVVDLISPIGKGQRGMIVSPPKAGKTTLLKDIARSILENDPDMHLIILLIDERPEEVTDIKEAIVGDRVEVIYSTFDELPEHHKRVSEMGIERAKRLVEHKQNVTILLDSITRLARAYNLTVPPSGRTLSGGLDPAALHMPKRFFGAARNMREGGSLTILATALVDTGSKMDDVVYEEFKGTGNMELVLDRKLSERRIFPAIDIQKSGTRREDLLLTKEEQEACYIMRKALNGMKGDEAVENILNTFVHTKDNAELVAKIRRQRYV